MSKHLVTKAFTGKTISATGASPMLALQAFNSLLEAHNSYHITREQEKTKRQQIQAWERVQVTSIQEQAKTIRDYLEYSFAERRENFKKLFDALDKGIENGNDVVVQAALTGILEITRQSPLADALAAARAVSDPNIKSIEI